MKTTKTLYINKIYSLGDCKDGKKIDKYNILIDIINDTEIIKST